MMEITTQYRRTRPLDAVFDVTVIAQDPSVHRQNITDQAARILTAKVRIPAEWLGPGPRGHRFHVVDYDETARMFEQPVSVMDETKEMEATSQPGWSKYKDRFVRATDDKLVTDPHFRAQNTFVIASRTLAAFESALGRRVPWSFGGQRLYLVPHALAMENAFYDAEDEGIYFGYFARDDGQRVQTGLSHDIIAHETTHAVLDGLRPRYLDPSLPDQYSFHEGLADIVALLSVFSMAEVVEEAIARAEKEGKLSHTLMGPEAFKRSLLLTLAEQWPGDDTYGHPVLGLRTSVYMHPNKRWLGDPEYEEPHLRGEILVAAVTQTLLRIWFNRLRILASANRRTSGPQRTEPPSHALVAEEGAKAAEHLLRMVIRAIDYMPPVDLEYEDVIDAIIEADTIMTPVDDHHYRQSLTNAFASFGIEKPEKTTVNISKTPLVYDNVNFTLLSSDPDEAFRFIWSNAPLLGIDRRFDICVDQVVPCVRTGPDGLMVHETIVTYVQSVEGTALELGKLLPARFDVSVELPRRAKFQMWGGGTLVFDQFGQVRHHQSKPLFDWDRQNRRLDYLLRTEAEDAEGRLAFAPHALSSRRRFPFHRPFAGGRRSEW